MTRIDLFVTSFSNFMNVFTLQRWKLTKTNHRHNGSHHDFDLTIPVDYNEEVPAYTGDGTITWNLTPKTQHRPTHEEFETKFIEYFEPHGDRVWNRVYLGDHHRVDDDNVYYVTIRLRMTNGHILPFPTPINNDLRFRQLERENERMRMYVEGVRNEINLLTEYWRHRVLREQERFSKLRRIRLRDRALMIENNARHVSRIVNKLKSYYRDQAQHEDCPICYENIDPDKLYVPGCCHYLCEPCAQHIILLNNKCPICRDELYTTSGMVEPNIAMHLPEAQLDPIL